MSWKDVVAKVAPSLATALGGPMAGVAVKAIGAALLGKEDATMSEVAGAVSSGLTPEAIVALRQADDAFKVRMRELDIDLERMFVDDVKDARGHNSDNDKVFWLGIAILGVFVVVCACAVVGAYFMLFTDSKPDPGIVAAVFTFIGTTVGYAASNAQSVVNFYFGSSKGSVDKTDALTQSIKAFGGRQI